MKLAAVLDRVLGRAHLEVEEGSVACPIRGRLDVEVCSSCPSWNRTEIDEYGQGVLICRVRAPWGGEATGIPPM